MRKRESRCWKKRSDWRLDECLWPARSLAITQERLFNFDAYAAQIESIQRHGGTPVIFQSYGLTRLPDTELIGAYEKIGSITQQFIGFELGQMFAPFGRIYSLDAYRELIKVPQCMGAKHSSLDRVLEWERLAVRDEVRPEFHVFTGNDLAIDMVIYGSDYLLGLEHDGAGSVCEARPHVGNG